MKFYDRIDVCDVLTLIRQASFKNVLLRTIGILTMSIEINSIAILNINDVDCRCIIIGINHKEAINLLKKIWFG